MFEPSDVLFQNTNLKAGSLFCGLYYGATCTSVGCVKIWKYVGINCYLLIQALFPRFVVGLRKFTKTSVRKTGLPFEVLNIFLHASSLSCTAPSCLMHITVNCYVEHTKWQLSLPNANLGTQSYGTTVYL